MPLREILLCLPLFRTFTVDTIEFLNYILDAVNQRLLSNHENSIIKRKDPQRTHIIRFAFNYTESIDMYYILV